MSPFVTRLSGRVALSGDDKAALLALPHHLKEAQPGDYIIREGDIAHYCHVLLFGFAHRHRISAYGTRHILGIHGKGDLLNLPSLPPLPSEDFVQALTAAQYATIPIEDVQVLARSRPAIGNALWTEMTAEVSVFRAWISNMGRRDARGRIAHLFCELVVRNHPSGGWDGCSVILPLSQAELADATGMTTVHVNRTLRVLEKEGFIVRERRRIMIPDWRRLKELADFRLSAWTGRMDGMDLAQVD